MSEQAKTTSGLVFRGAKVVLPPGKYVDCTFLNCRLFGAGVEIHDSFFFSFTGRFDLSGLDFPGNLITGCRLEAAYCAPYTSRINAVDRFTSPLGDPLQG